jgi:hypothetical protein
MLMGEKKNPCKRPWNFNDWIFKSQKANGVEWANNYLTNR